MNSLSGPWFRCLQQEMIYEINLDCRLFGAEKRQEQPLNSIMKLRHLIF